MGVCRICKLLHSARSPTTSAVSHAVATFVFKLASQFGECSTVSGKDLRIDASMRRATGGQKSSHSVGSSLRVFVAKSDLYRASRTCDRQQLQRVGPHADVMGSSFVSNTGRFDNEITLVCSDGLDGQDLINIKPRKFIPFSIALDAFPFSSISSTPSWVRCSRGSTQCTSVRTLRRHLCHRRGDDKFWDFGSLFRP